MKNFKRFTAAIAATLMAASLSVPMAMNVSAVGEEVTITMKDGDETNTTSTFKAYRILDATISGTNYNYTVNDTYRELLKSALNLGNDAKDDDIIAEIEKLNADSLRPVADELYKAILTGNITENAIAESGVFSGLNQGYYLIAETALGNADTDGTMSLVMVETMGENSVPVTTKKEAPTFQKKVQDTNDTTGETSGWQDSADYDIGDDVPFQLKATLPDDYDKYSQYKLVFHDNLRNGFDTPDSVTVYVDKNKNGQCDDGEEIDPDGFNAEASEHDEFDCDFEVTIPNLKADTSIDKTMPVYVEYTAKLNSDAKIGSLGNWNDAYLEFSNNPYHTGSGDTTSKTVIDTNVVFTYKTVINKVNADAEPLTGAKFKLEKKLADETRVLVKEYTVDDDDTSTFEFKGLDDGTYVLTETVKPDGFKQIDPIEFTISATHTNDPETLALTELKGEIDKGANDILRGEITVNTEDEDALGAAVLNRSGSQLPSTGGIGTTLFFVGGGSMVAVAGIFLITKKRMGKNAE